MIILYRFIVIQLHTSVIAMLLLYIRWIKKDEESFTRSLMTLREDKK